MAFSFLISYPNYISNFSVYKHQMHVLHSYAMGRTKTDKQAYVGPVVVDLETARDFRVGCLREGLFVTQALKQLIEDAIEKDQFRSIARRVREKSPK
jgi:hypothetical protein